MVAGRGAWACETSWRELLPPGACTGTERPSRSARVLLDGNVQLMPKDSHGRTIDYLRMSVTDHCNLRCVYCMPLAGPTFAPHEELLTAEELVRVARAAASVGFRKIRITGGEPTLREDLVEIVSGISGLRGIEDVSLTTNGMLLPGKAAALKAAGLTRVNIHVDSLRPEHVERIMRFGSLEQVWSGIEAAEAAGLRPIKLNVVVAQGYNDEDVADLARLTLSRDWHVRFVELMPLGNGECADVARSRYVSNGQTQARIEAALGTLEELVPFDRSDESRNFRLPGGRGVVGFISPVSDPYCETCNRMRLTADGKFHLCLLNDDEMDVKRALRAGAGDEAVAAVLVRAVAEKPVGHRLEQGVSTRSLQMFQIGG